MIRPRGGYRCIRGSPVWDYSDDDLARLRYFDDTFLGGYFLSTPSVHQALFLASAAYDWPELIGSGRARYRQVEFEVWLQLSLSNAAPVPNPINAHFIVVYWPDETTPVVPDDFLGFSDVNGVRSPDTVVPGQYAFSDRRYTVLAHKVLVLPPVGVAGVSINNALANSFDIQDLHFTMILDLEGLSSICTFGGTQQGTVAVCYWNDDPGVATSAYEIYWRFRTYFTLD